VTGRKPKMKIAELNSMLDLHFLWEPKPVAWTVGE